MTNASQDTTWPAALQPAFLLTLSELRADDGEGALRVVVALRSAVDHARERALRRESARFEPASQRGLGVGEIDEDRRLERCERARQQRPRDRIVVGDQGPELRRQPAVATEQETGDPAVAFGNEFGRGRRPRRPRSTPLRSAPKAAAS